MLQHKTGHSHSQRLSMTDPTIYKRGIHKLRLDFPKFSIYIRSKISAQNISSDLHCSQCKRRVTIRKSIHYFILKNHNRKNNSYIEIFGWNVDTLTTSNSFILFFLSFQSWHYPLRKVRLQYSWPKHMTHRFFSHPYMSTIFHGISFSHLYCCKNDVTLFAKRNLVILSKLPAFGK